MADLPPHGTDRRYERGCRQACCRAAHAAKARARTRAIAYGTHTPRSMPSVGAQRRCEALMTLGWTWAVLSRRLGLSDVRLHAAFTKQGGISPGLHARIAALYDELWATPAPTETKGQRINAARAKALARRRGYAPPLAWDDDEIDNPEARPWRPKGSEPWDLRPCGTLAAVRRHQRHGEPLDERCRAAQSRREDEAA